MLVRKILRPCLVLKKTTALTQRIFAYHVTHLQKVKDDVQSKSLENSSDTLMMELNTTFPTKIMLCLENNKNDVSGPHILKALSSYMRLYQNKKSMGEDCRDFTNQDFFKELCSVIHVNIDKITGSEIVQILNFFERMNVPKNLGILQTLFRHVKSHVNDLSITDISALGLLIKKFQFEEGKQLLDTLKHKFIVKMSIEFDGNNISHLEHALSFICFDIKSHKLKYTILKKLQQYKGEIPINTAISILSSLCENHHVPYSQKQMWFDIYHKMIDILNKNTEFLAPEHILYIILIMTELLKSDRRISASQYYDANFYDNLIRKIISDNMGLEKALSVLKSLNFIRHESEELLNYCCASYFERTVLSEAKITEEEGKLLILIHGLALSKHKSVLWSQIEGSIKNNEKLWFSYDYDTLCILALNLTLLDFYPHFLLEKVFDGQCDYSRNKYMHWTFCKLCQKVKSEPGYSGPMPTTLQEQGLTKLMKESWAEKNNHRCHFEKPLMEWLGDGQYFLNNVGTKLFHVIDHVLAFDKNGEPIPINTRESRTDGFQYLEDVEFPPDCKKICLKYGPFHWYWRNTHRLLGLHTIPIETLEAMGYEVVIVNQLEWLAVPADQTKDFIVNKIKEKLDH